METKIYNIDSAFRNKTKYPSSTNFTYNTLDTQSQVIPFQEKNVIGIKVLSVEIPNTMYYINSDRGNNIFKIDGNTFNIADGSYTSTDLITYLNTLVLNIDLDFISTSYDSKIEISSGANQQRTVEFPLANNGHKSLGQILGFSSLSYTIGNNSSIKGETTIYVPQYQYFFLRINDLGNIINNNTNYLVKNILSKTNQFSDTNSGSSYEYITNPVVLEQPTDITNLKITLEDSQGNIISLNGNDFSFTLELTVITNTILKNYDQIKFYSEPVMQRILQAKMLAYYEKEVSKEVNDSLTGTYNANLTNLNNIVEYTPYGNRNNYYNSSSSYYNNMDNIRK